MADVTRKTDNGAAITENGVVQTSVASANFVLKSPSVESPVNPGDTPNVVGTVKNTGSATGTQQVTLDVTTDGIGQVASTNDITLSPGSDELIGLEWTSTQDKLGDYDILLATDDDTFTDTITIESETPATFDVRDVSTNSPVTAGQDIDVTYTVKNTGEETATQDITLDANGTNVDTQFNVQLSGGQSTTNTLSWTTTSADVGTSPTVTVASADDSVQKTVTVESGTTPAYFDVKNVTTNSPVTAGESVNVSYTVENTGDETATQDITLDANGTNVDTQFNVQLSSGQSTTNTLSWTTTSADVGTSPTVTVASADDSVQKTVTVESQPAAPFFDVDIIGSPGPVRPPGDITVSAQVTNTGEAFGSQDITFTVDGTEIKVVQDVALNADENTTVQASFFNQGTDALSVSVSSFDDTDSTTVDTVFFTVNSISANPNPAAVGDDVDVTAEFENIGSTSGSGTGIYLIDELQQTTASLNAGSNTTVSKTKTLTMPNVSNSATFTAAADGDSSQSTTVLVSDGGFTASEE